MHTIWNDNHHIMVGAWYREVQKGIAFARRNKRGTFFYMEGRGSLIHCEYFHNYQRVNDWDMRCGEACKLTYKLVKNGYIDNLKSNAYEGV